MEELGLGAFLAGQELDVVDEQDVDAAVALAEVEDRGRSGRALIISFMNRSDEM